MYIFVVVGIKDNFSAVSLVCNYSQSTLQQQSHLHIHTLVLKNHFQNNSQTRPPAEKYYVLSLVLEGFIHPSLSSTLSNTFDETILQYLTVYHSSLDSHSFLSSISLFSRLEAITIESSYLPMLESAFSEADWPHLNRLTIKSTDLGYIERDAFTRGKENLRMLVLSENELKGLLWLVSPDLRLTKLWHLDLQSNQLSHLPSNLRDHLPSVRVLRLGGNRFLHFEQASLRPWFAADEVNLYEFTLKNKNYTTLPYTRENVWLKNLSFLTVKANFFISSFVAGFSYDCQEGNSLLDWAQFMENCSSVYQVIPGKFNFF